MKKEKEPKVIKVSDEELSKLKEDLQKSNLSESQKKILLAALEGYHWLSKLYEAKKLSLKKIKRLFGFKTEKVPKEKPVEDESNNKSKNEDKNNDDKSGGNGSGAGRGGRPKGSGKKGKDDHTDAKKVIHKLHDLEKGSLCPGCEMGKLYPVKPGVHIQFMGQAPIQTTIHETEKLRCNACGEYFEAELPEKNKKKYHPSADVVIAVQKYGLGQPFYRTGKWQNDLGTPLPPSTQWERCEKLGESVYPVYEKLLEIAADGDLFHIDDTKNKILDVQKTIRDNNEKRVGIYTTGVISKVKNKLIKLFFTGRNYAGENLDNLLSKRKSEAEILLMSDALQLNLPRDIKVTWANCLTHSRRNFWDYLEKYPKMVRYILFQFKKVYINDKKTKEMNDEDRLVYHQKYSEKILLKLRRWGLKKLYTKKIEPNEELGEAFKYYFKHFEKLTQFLRIPGAPIDNTIVERLLKTPILNRKNSYFYKTQFGAFVGDMIMSLIETSKSVKINPQKYLQALHENKDWVKKTPSDWLPWNFENNFS